MFSNKIGVCFVAKSCQAALCVEPFWPNAQMQSESEAKAYAFGKNLGLAFQVRSSIGI